MIKIVTDSTCDLPLSLLRRYDIAVVPINIQFGAETYEEGIDVDQSSFYRRIDELKMIPTTSQPSAGRFAQVYRRIAAEGAKTILSIHATAKLSGTYQSSELAAQAVADEVSVHSFDSACGSAALGFMVLEGARMAKSGESGTSILRRLEQIRPRMRVLFTVSDLRYAQMSGRVGKLRSSLASILDIKPIVGLEDGVIDVVGQVRTRKKAVAQILKLMMEEIGTTGAVNLAVTHAEAPQEGRDLLDQAQRIFNCQETFIEHLALSLAAQFGPGTLGLMGYRI